MQVTCRPSRSCWYRDLCCYRNDNCVGNVAKLMALDYRVKEVLIDRAPRLEDVAKRYSADMMIAEVANSAVPVAALRGLSRRGASMRVAGAAPGLSDVFNFKSRARCV